MPLQLNLPAAAMPASPQATLAALQALAPIPAEAARQLAALWQDSNQSLLDSNSRLALFGHFQQALVRILPALENDYRLRELSATLRARKAAALARRLQLARLLTLKLCLQQAEAPPAALQLHLLQSVLDASHDVLATHLASYHPLPAMFWRDSHRLYQHACASGHGDDVALATRYKALLLLGLCNSNRLPPAQIARLLELASSAATQLLLGTCDAAGEGFYVDTDADQPPGYHDTPPEAGWMLDTRPLVDALRQQLQMQSHGTPGAHAEDGELFQALLHDCQRKAERHEVRIKMGGTLSLVSTLPACWHHSNGGSWSFAPTGDSSEELIYHSQLARRSPPPAPASMTIINRSCSGMQLAGNSL
ncbi:hypothetical protein, partial [Craterilacuibacter sp.]|uniref:hypothetical protein n=1 Tax=Craterilacuibacter sp. TaxID=2870909 RepID=UPI003F35C004